ncbi:hypothetical protein QN277_024157 [Acacia crassicarpa]|uniref:Uncharacterized protein n=1 Tax=Acacia crassicarpa TaxID=499986 RepID=A0AAE1MJV2_9FABA|nr:hypothetical protein QN277_024157 [Acacia crassicarpa]
MILSPTTLLCEAATVPAPGPGGPAPTLLPRPRIPIPRCPRCVCCAPPPAPGKCCPCVCPRPPPAHPPTY